MAGFWTLDDALNLGQGIERPFRCPDHDDTNASASVNVIKGVWTCYACNAAGSVKDKKAPTAAQLAAMLNPEQACRIYPESWLELFLDADYWLGRFPDWLCWHLGLGTDPFSGNSTFPVRTAEGRLAGVGMRVLHPAEDEPRYRYPQRWSASRTLGGYEHADQGGLIGVFVEGYADMSSLREIGADSYAVFGSGVHLPQFELARRLNKKAWLLGFDMDDAGERAAAAAHDVLVTEGRVARIEWPKKDPAECTPEQRLSALVTALHSVGRPDYGLFLDHWKQRVDRTITSYQQWLEERAA